MKPVTTRTHTKRLRKLADILAKFRPGKGPRAKKFYMRTWGTHDASHHPEEGRNFCGTAACALGHAAMDKGFRRAGLRMEWKQEYTYNATCTLQSMGNFEATIIFDNEEGVLAGAKFFGLTFTEATWVFFAVDEKKKEIVRRLRELAKNRVELQ